jgi:hypothetical protein
MPSMSRRKFLSLFSVLADIRPAGDGAVARSQNAYKMDAGVFYGLMNLKITGTIASEVDPVARRWRVTTDGQGAGVVHRAESVGFVREGRCYPTASRMEQTIRGRDATVSVGYDYARGLVEYHSVSHTFFLGRRRQVDDTLRLPPGQPVDDLASGSLNFAANKLDGDGQGGYRTLIVRRAWKDNEGPDDVSASGYRAMLAPVWFRVTPDPATGGLRGQLDMTSLSSWARANQPARLSFDAQRHLQSFETSLILGTTVSLRLASGA